MPISRIETASLAAGLVAPSATTATTATALTTASGSAPSYSARAWVNFDGTGTVAIRASGNVSSITDNGAGDYTANFTTAMPDANYSAVTSCGLTQSFSQTGAFISGGSTASGTRIVLLTTSGVFVDENIVTIAIFR